MPNKTYTYFPPTGALPGKSFEKQTVDFFEGLQEQVDNLNTRISNIEKQSGSDLSQILQQLADIQATLTSMQSAIVLAQNTADAARNVADSAFAGSVPIGSVVLMHGMVTAENWAVADGNDGTIDLSNYTNSTDVVYMQRKAITG